MKENYESRIKRTGDKSDMIPGEGARMFHNISAIQDILDPNGTQNVVEKYIRHDPA